jgi:hypothetical protein
MENEDIVCKNKPKTFDNVHDSHTKLSDKFLVNNQCNIVVIFNQGFMSTTHRYFFQGQRNKGLIFLRKYNCPKKKKKNLVTSTVLTLKECCCLVYLAWILLEAAKMIP